MVAPAACGPAEIVAPECGRLFVPGDAHSAADALVALLGTPGLPARVGEAGRRRAERMYRLELSSRAVVLFHDVNVNMENTGPASLKFGVRSFFGLD